MKCLYTAFFKGFSAELDAAAIRREVDRFAGLLVTAGVDAVRVWCSHNPYLPADSPLQSPDRIVEPAAVTPFFDEAVRNEVWTYGDVFNRAMIEALDGSFSFFLGNDKDLTLKTNEPHLLDATRSAWLAAGYEVDERDMEKGPS